MRLKFLDCVDLINKSPVLSDVQISYVSTSAANSSGIITERIEGYDFKDRPSRANLTAVTGDVLFARMAATKKAILIDSSSEEYVYSTGFAVVRPKRGIITSDCLYHLVRSKSFEIAKDALATGATQEAITNSGLKKLTVSIPPFCEQEEVCQKLSSIERQRHLLNTQMKILDELLESRFIEMFGNPVENQLGWETFPLVDLCASIVDCPHSTPKYTSDNTGHRCIRTSTVKKNRLLWDDIEFISEEEYKKRTKRREPKKGDIVYTREGAILGIAAPIDRDYPIALGQRCMLLSPNFDLCTTDYLCSAMNLDAFLHYALRGLAGSASPHINVGDIKAFKMPLPPLPDQLEFSAFVNGVNDVRTRVQNSINQLQMLYDSLMQKYFGD